MPSTGEAHPLQLWGILRAPVPLRRMRVAFAVHSRFCGPPRNAVQILLGPDPWGDPWPCRLRPFSEPPMSSWGLMYRSVFGSFHLIDVSNGRQWLHAPMPSPSAIICIPSPNQKLRVNVEGRRAWAKSFSHFRGGSIKFPDGDPGQGSAAPHRHRSKEGRSAYPERRLQPLPPPDLGAACCGCLAAGTPLALGHRLYKEQNRPWYTLRSIGRAASPIKVFHFGRFHNRPSVMVPRAEVIWQTAPLNHCPRWVSGQCPGPGGRLQPVLMRHPPQLPVKTWRGGGGGAGGCRKDRARPPPRGPG